MLGPASLHVFSKLSVCAIEKSKILAQEWFTVDFNTRVKAVVKHIRTSDMIEDNVRSKLSPSTYSDTKSNIQTRVSLYVSGVHLPTHLLCGP